MTSTTEHREAVSDLGIGLIEIVVSMFLLSLLALSFAPVLVNAVQTSAQNTTRAAATQLVNERMQIAQDSGPSCSSVASLSGSHSLTDPRDIVIEVTTTVDACPVGVGTVLVSTVAVRSDTEEVLAEASTLVFVE